MADFLIRLCFIFSVEARNLEFECGGLINQHWCIFGHIACYVYLASGELVELFFEFRP